MNNGLWGKLKSGGMQKFLALLALIILYIFFAIFGKNFVSSSTLISILDSSYYIGFLAIGVTFVIITGGIDLSIGTVMMCSSLLGGLAYSKWGFPFWLALVVVVVTGTLFGLLNGVLVSKLGLPPFIATLGTMMISQGFGSIITGVQTMRYPAASDPGGWYKSIFYKTPSTEALPNGFPTGVIFLLAFFVIAYLLLNKTRLGRYTYAIGSNEEAVRLSGVKVQNWKLLIYVISGLFAGLAGIVYAATYSTIIPGTGNGLELQAISAVVIGGTSLSGGIGSIFGTIIGVYIMSTLSNGLMSMNLQGQYQTFFTGIVVIAAVLLDVYRNNKANKI